jgi:hypothetical protein
MYKYVQVPFKKGYKLYKNVSYEGISKTFGKNYKYHKTYIIFEESTNLFQGVCSCGSKTDWYTKFAIPAAEITWYHKSI